MSNIDLVVTDLDGTFWETDDYTHPRTLAAVDELAARGVQLLIATGRRLMSTQVPLARLDLAPPAVILNGGLGVHLDTGERFHRGGFSAEDAAAVLDRFRSLDVQPCVYVDDDDHPVRLDAAPSTHAGHIESFAHTKRTDDLARVVAEETVLAFSVLGVEAGTATELDRVMRDVAVPHAAPDRQYGRHGVTVAPNDVSKWEGIAAFCDAHGIDAGRCLVIGDGPNDVEMLEQAAIAVAMGDAHPAALAVADHVVGNAVDGGWADLLDLF